MGIADEFERRLERAVEGFFSRTFRSRVQPAEIGRRLLREMEAGKSVSVGAVYVPNRYVVRLSAPDHERMEGLVPTLRKDFSEWLQAHARDRRWRPAGMVQVEFREDEEVQVGRFAVEAFHESSENGQGDTPAWLVGPGERRHTLEGDSLTIGRLDSCQIVLDDPNASRRHAELTRREDGWWIVDLGSTNGTLVNGSLVKERRLEPGDQLQIGSTELAFFEER